MNNITEQLSKTELKQVDLNIRDNRLIYLVKIIIIVNERMKRLERYILDIGDQLLKDYTHQNIPYEEAMLYLDAVDQIHGYLLNVLGDSQNTSISYFKYRNFCKKKKYSCINLDNETEEYLKELNKERNFCNHIPESILAEDIQAIKHNFKDQNNKLESFQYLFLSSYDFYEYEFFNNKNEAIKRFYFGVKHVYECIVSDYEAALGKKVDFILKEAETLVKAGDEYVQRAAKNVQKIDGAIPDEWMDFKD